MATEFDEWKETSEGKVVFIELEKALVAAWYAGSMKAIEAMGTRMTKLLDNVEAQHGRVQKSESGTGSAEAGTVRTSGER
jgi:hypothetical protein